MVDTRFPIRQIAAHQVQLEFIQRAGTRSGPEVEFATRACFLFGNACRKVKYPGQVREYRNSFSISSDAAGGNYRQGSNAGLICISWQWKRINSRVDF